MRDTAPVPHMRAVQVAEPSTLKTSDQPLKENSREMAASETGRSCTVGVLPPTKSTTPPAPSTESPNKADRVRSLTATNSAAHNRRISSWQKNRARKTNTRSSTTDGQRRMAMLKRVLRSRAYLAVGAVLMTFSLFGEDIRIAAVPKAYDCVFWGEFNHR